MKLFITLSLLSCVSATFAMPSGKGDKPYHRHIQWHACGDTETKLKELYTIPLPIECATLPVPLDYKNPKAGKLDLDLLRVKAIKEPVLGSVLFDSGGPGGSNVDAVAVSSAQLHEVLGGNYNLIGWDPRGTGKTIPFNCSIPSGPTPPPSGNQRRDVILQRNLTEFLFEGGWSSAEIFADTCYKKMNATGELIGTAFVVRDMVEIIDALGEDGLLRYWGLSYGTQLGSTFAAMFPERVDRMLLDAVTNPHEYVAGTWMHSLLQADKAYRAFLTECANAPKKCSLASFIGPKVTADDLQEAIDAGVQQLLEISTVQDGMLSYGLLKYFLYRRLYDPNTWSSLADDLVSLLNGTYSIAMTSTPQTDAASPSPYSLGQTAFEGIRCSDTVWRANSAEEILDIVKEQSTISSFSDVFYDQLWRCAAWKMDAKEKYIGKFSAKTKFPILLVGGAYDPVTPLVSAFNTSAGFENSVVLTHRGYGHGLMSHPSSCTAKAVSAYFANGTMPQPGTECEPDLPVFEYIESLQVS